MSAQSFRLVPPVSACVRWGLLAIGTVGVAATLFTTLVRLLKGLSLPAHWSTSLLQMLGFAIALGVVLGLVIYGIGLLWGATISADSLSASNYWGRKVKVPWTSITGIEPTSIQGLPALLIRSSATSSVLYVYTLGLDTAEAYKRLCLTAGPSNPLTTWFAPSAT
jgi:hypothetical protein